MRDIMLDNLELVPNDNNDIEQPAARWFEQSEAPLYHIICVETGAVGK
jgi:hypothetical protein